MEDLCGRVCKVAYSTNSEMSHLCALYKAPIGSSFLENLLTKNLILLTLQVMENSQTFDKLSQV
jgi:hypothetical protein